mmetsp:Transcript_1471/g.2514  ORF Transcript_1471/g.2514 Transcript_1471/m.2514 type:complete len:168 (+) Transcript_1471:195-698(+)
MDDDPDDLAAAFFAAQASKEKAKATLPTDDWSRVIDNIEANKQSASSGSAASVAAVVDGKDAGTSSTSESCTLNMANGGNAVNPSSWLVTTMPRVAPKYHTSDEDGIVGIIVDSNDARCSRLGLGGNHDLEVVNERKYYLTAAEKEMRCRMKAYLVKKLEEKMKDAA